MGTSSQQDQAFIRDVISDRILEEAIEWIKTNMEPDEVFDEKDLEFWAYENGFEPIDN